MGIKFGELYKPEKGSVVLVTLIFTLGLFLLGSTLANLAYCESLMAKYHSGAQQALYLAEAGIEKARARLDEGIFVPDGYEDLTLRFDEGEVRVVINSPDQDQLIGIKSTAVLNSGLRKTVIAQFRPNSRVGILTNRLIADQYGTGVCTIKGDIAARELTAGENFHHVGTLYSGYMVSSINLNYFRQRAEAGDPGWLVYSGFQALTGTDFIAHPNIFVDGDVNLDEGITACPLGSLLVATGSVYISPNQKPDREMAELSIICHGDMRIEANGNQIPRLNGYLHSNSQLEIDLSGFPDTIDSEPLAAPGSSAVNPPGVSSPVTFGGILEGDKVIIRYQDGDFTFEQDLGCAKTNRYLQQSLEGVVSYREVIE